MKLLRGKLNRVRIFSEMHHYHNETNGRVLHVYIILNEEKLTYKITAEIFFSID